MALSIPSGTKPKYPSFLQLSRLTLDWKQQSKSKKEGIRVSGWKNAWLPLPVFENLQRSSAEETPNPGIVPWQQSCRSTFRISLCGFQSLCPYSQIAKGLAQNRTSAKWHGRHYSRPVVRLLMMPLQPTLCNTPRNLTDNLMDRPSSQVLPAELDIQWCPSSFLTHNLKWAGSFFPLLLCASLTLAGNKTIFLLGVYEIYVEGWVRRKFQIHIKKFTFHFSPVTCIPTVTRTCFFIMNLVSHKLIRHTFETKHNLL